jgi:hypothetical protein
VAGTRFESPRVTELTGKAAWGASGAVWYGFGGSGIRAEFALGGGINRPQSLLRLAEAARHPEITSTTTIVPLPTAGRN